MDKLTRRTAILYREGNTLLLMFDVHAPPDLLEPRSLTLAVDEDQVEPDVAVFVEILDAKRRGHTALFYDRAPPDPSGYLVWMKYYVDGNTCL